VKFMPNTQPDSTEVLEAPTMASAERIMRPISLHLIGGLAPNRLIVAVTAVTVLEGGPVTLRVHLARSPNLLVNAQYLQSVGGLSGR
jgi:hypothetical protein